MRDLESFVTKHEVEVENSNFFSSTSPSSFSSALSPQFLSPSPSSPPPRPPSPAPSSLPPSLPPSSLSSRVAFDKLREQNLSLERANLRLEHEKRYLELKVDQMEKLRVTSGSGRPTSAPRLHSTKDRRRNRVSGGDFPSGSLGVFRGKERLLDENARLSVENQRLKRRNGELEEKIRRQKDRKGGNQRKEEEEEEEVETMGNSVTRRGDGERFAVSERERSQLTLNIEMERREKEAVRLRADALGEQVRTLRNELDEVKEICCYICLCLCLCRCVCVYECSFCYVFFLLLFCFFVFFFTFFLFLFVLLLFLWCYW